MSALSYSWLALDVGGANIKAAHTSGAVRVLPFELWKRPEELTPVLSTLVGAFPPAQRFALTMTAELCDCFATKSEGVNAVLDAVGRLHAEGSIRVWGIDGRLHAVAEVRARPELAAAANWLALATLAARLAAEGSGLLIDIGSTTTDLIPLRDGHAAPRGRSDTDRLQTGELVYAGIRRTPICALATELPLRGVPTGLAAELFASTLDVYLTLGELAPDPDDLATSDGRPATVDAARDRLARMVCADRDRFTTDDARAFAQSADAVLIARLDEAAKRACESAVGRPRTAVLAGSGDFLARRLAERVVEPGGTIVSLNQAWGPVASGAGCAFALATLAAERGDDPEGARPT
jgi:(4-(4-[2-(gamma-L-glutamylamino)ethyl]phenoxymethyl)furan-2-yl)methanamine synthase